MVPHRLTQCPSFGLSPFVQPLRGSGTARRLAITHPKNRGGYSTWLRLRNYDGEFSRVTLQPMLSKSTLRELLRVFASMRRLLSTNSSLSRVKSWLSDAERDARRSLLRRSDTKSKELTYLKSGNDPVFWHYFDESEVHNLFVEAGFHDSRILRVSELGESWDNVFIGFGRKP